MNDCLCRQDAGEGEWTENNGKQHHQHGLLRGPERRHVGRVKHSFRGKFQKVLAEVIAQQRKNEMSIQPTSRSAISPCWELVNMQQRLQALECADSDVSRPPIPI